MLKKYKRITGLFMAFTVAFLLFAPIVAQASEIQRAEAAVKEEFLSKSEDALFSACGAELSAGMRTVMTERNMTIKDDTRVELLSTGSDNATAIVVTNVEGNLVTKGIWMGMDDEGEMISLASSEAAARNVVGGVSGSQRPFGNSLEIVFYASYKAYSYGTDAHGIIQPQTLMFMYYDDDDLYGQVDVNSKYSCYGVEGYYSNGVFTPVSSNPLERYAYNISLIQTNANARTYYSKTKAMSSGRAILMYDGIGGGHDVEYTITVNVGEANQMQRKRVVELFPPLN